MFQKNSSLVGSFVVSAEDFHEALTLFGCFVFFPRLHSKLLLMVATDLSIKKSFVTAEKRK